MKTHTRVLFMTLCGPIVILAALAWSIAPAVHSAPIPDQPIAIQIDQPAPAIPPVVFLHDPNWPSYAQTEITVFPDPPNAREPAEICVWLINTSAATQTVSVDLGFANFGLGLPFTAIGSRSMDVPPNMRVKVCWIWIPPTESHWCVQATLHVPGYPDQTSQRNLDIWETLEPGVPAQTVFPVRNNTSQPTDIQMSLVNLQPGWQAFLEPPTLIGMKVDDLRPVTLTVIPPSSGTPLGSRQPIVDVEARDFQQNLIGGFRKLDWPPVALHRPQDPPYAESEISIDPYPPRAGEPTLICVELRNTSDVTQTVEVEFSTANFGIGLPFTPIQMMPVTLPPHSVVKHCVTWVPPFGGQFCAQIHLIDPHQHYADQFSQRNLDVAEVLLPGQPDRLILPVRNPFPFTTDISLTLDTYLPGWQIALDRQVLPGMPAYGLQLITATIVPGNFVPADGAPVADIEAYGFVTQPPEHWQLIGGIRKIYRPPIPIHLSADPPYAESEIHIDPYPPREREPTEICADLRNPTDLTQTLTVTFAVANFGIGLPFHDIARPIVITLPPHSTKTVCITWVPPFGGHFCAQITIESTGHPSVRSQRNMDVGEIFIPGQPSALVLPIGNPATRTVTVTLGLVPHVEGWQIELSQDVLPNLGINAVRLVTLTVTPPLNQPFPPPDSPVVDVEGYIDGQLIGGIRKLFEPPIPVHEAKDPPYAESEIFVDPYPVWQGGPTTIGALVFNPTDAAQQVTATFGVAHFGIGMPFTQTGVFTPTTVVNIPPHGMVRVQTIWIAQWQGHACVQIKIQSAGHDPVYSQRNIDVGEPLNPQQPHARVIEVRNPTAGVVTITLALISYRSDWQISIMPAVLTNMAPDGVRAVTLTVKPSSWIGLVDEQPIADVEAYINGELIGGIRKIAKPPIPLHKPQDRSYAESEISVTPYPLIAGKPATLTTQVMNTSEVTQSIRVEFGVANFGLGIPFTNTNLVPTYRVITLGPGLSQTVGAVWTSPPSGHWCIQIKLRDPLGLLPDQWSQRNVDIERRDFSNCLPFTKDFLLQNSTNLPVTVTLGSSAINLPAGWTWSTNITETMLLPHQGISVTLTITPPCTPGLRPMPLSPLAISGTSGTAMIDVEGYADGQLIGGIEVQLETALPEKKVYLPIVLKSR